MIVIVIYEEMPSQEIATYIEDIRTQTRDDVYTIFANPPDIYLQPSVALEADEYEGFFYLNRTVEVVNTSAHSSPDI